MVIMDTNEFLMRYDQYLRLPGGLGFQEKRPYAKMADGYCISIQASRTHYCDPSEDGLSEYKKVELGYPNWEDELINEYAEEDDDYTQTVYGYVPVEVVNKLIRKHGGITKVRTLVSRWRTGTEETDTNSEDFGFRDC